MGGLSAVCMDGYGRDRRGLCYPNLVYRPARTAGVKRCIEPLMTPTLLGCSKFS